MKIIICPDKFKGSLSAKEVSKAIEAGIKRFDPSIQTIIHPLADGGDGSVSLVNEYLQYEEVEIEVLDPLGRKIKASYALGEDTALIEMASASGITLLDSSELDIMKATSYGTGQMVTDALDRGAKKIFLFIGGSATNDGGIGIAAACGYRFLDKQGQVLHPNAVALNEMYSIDTSVVAFDLSGVEFITVCDVDNPFYGPNGAAFVYAKQKGASEKQIELLDNGLQNLAGVIKAHLGKDISNVAGAGAAGGVGGGSIAFLGARMERGIDTIMSLTQYEKAARNADLIVSGEGKADIQSLSGKVISGVANYANLNQVPFALIVGKNELTSEHSSKLNILYIRDLFSEVESVEEAMQNASNVVETVAYKMISEIMQML